MDVPKEKITTTTVAGTLVTEENPSWKYTLGGTNLSEFGIMEAASGFSYTDIEAIIEDWWDSPVYEMQVPEGSKLEVIRLIIGD